MPSCRLKCAPSLPPSLSISLSVALKWPIKATNCQPAALMKQKWCWGRPRLGQWSTYPSPCSSPPLPRRYTEICVLRVRRSLWPYKSVWNTVKFVHNNRKDGGNAHKVKNISLLFSPEKHKFLIYAIGAGPGAGAIVINVFFDLSRPSSNLLFDKLGAYKPELQSISV